MSWARWIHSRSSHSVSHTYSCVSQMILSRHIFRLKFRWCFVLLVPPISSCVVFDWIFCGKKSINRCGETWRFHNDEDSLSFLFSAAILVRIALFRDIMRRRVVIVYRRFGTTYLSHLLVLLTLENGTDTLSRNVSKQLPSRSRVMSQKNAVLRIHIMCCSCLINSAWRQKSNRRNYCPI
jgi:hypothetical protein